MHTAALASLVAALPDGLCCYQIHPDDWQVARALMPGGTRWLAAPAHDPRGNLCHWDLLCDRRLPGFKVARPRPRKGGAAARQIPAGEHAARLALALLEGRAPGGLRACPEWAAVLRGPAQARADAAPAPAPPPAGA